MREKEEKSIGITLISTKSNGRRVNGKWGRIEVYERTEKLREGQDKRGTVLGLMHYN